VAYGDPVSPIPGNTSIQLENVTIVVDKTSDTSTNTFEIVPNKMYMFGPRTSLTITLATPSDNTIVNEYMFQFTSGNTATTLNVPSSVTWLKDPDIQTGKKYEVSIENNLGIIGEWSNE
jgi:archaellin